MSFLPLISLFFGGFDLRNLAMTKLYEKLYKIEMMGKAFKMFGCYRENFYRLPKANIWILIGDR